MNENQNIEDLSERLQAADPAANLEAPHESLIHRAIAAAETTGDQKPASKLLGFLKPRNRVALVRGLSTAGVMAVALAFAAPSILGSLPSGSGSSYLFSLAGSTGSGQKMAASSDTIGAASSISGGTAATMDICRGVDGNPCGTMPSQFVYHGDSGLSTATPAAQVYKFVPNRSPNQTLTAVAAAFDVTGTSRTFDSPDSSWTTLYKGQNPDGSEGYGKPTVSVSFDTKAQILNWNYQGPEMLYTNCANQEAEAQIVYPNTQDSSKPVCLVGISGRGPTTAEAVARTKAIFKSIGYDSGTNLKSLQDGDLYIEVPQDPNTQRAGVNINGYLVVDGQVTTMAMTVGWDGSSKEISYGYGFDGQAVSQGNFGTVSASAAVERLGNWQWYGNPYLDYANLKYSETMNQGVAIDVIAPEVQDTTAGSSTGTSGSATVAPDTNSTAPSGVAPSDVAPTPQVVNVTVTRAQSTLMTLYAADGTIWFVPGFVFYDATGYVGNVLSIVPGIIKLPEVTPLTDVMVK